MKERVTRGAHPARRGHGIGTWTLLRLTLVWRRKPVDLMAALRKSLEGGGAELRQRAERFVAAKAKPRKAGGRTRAA